MQISEEMAKGLSDREIRVWLSQLSRDPRTQSAVVRDLVRHATTDRMSADDRAVCCRALRMLHTAELFHA